VRSETFQPIVEILMQPGFVVVDKDGGRDMHGVPEANLVPPPFPLHWKGLL
jgi:hypothetical protein